MISLVRGPGGLVRRMADDAVPLAIALALGGVALMFAGPLGTALVAGLSWPLASALLRAVRRRPALRRLYRIALVAHVLFWSAQGILATERAPAGEPRVAGASAWSEASLLQVGYGEGHFGEPRWAPLAGWGSRPRRIRWPAFGGLGPIGRFSQAWMAEPQEDGSPRMPLFRTASQTTDESNTQHVIERLGARAIVIRPDGAAIGEALVIVRLDLVTSSKRLHTAIATRLAEQGIEPERLLVAATHTHSGPGGYSDNPVSALFGTDHHNPTLEKVVVDAAVQACTQARKRAVPATMAFVKARDRDPQTGAPLLARNRRADEGAIDDRVYALRFDARATGKPLAVLLNYAVHSYIYRRRHMHFQRDLAGGLEDALQLALPGRPPVVFVNGALGDVSTQRVAGAPAQRIEALSQRFARAIAPSIAAAPAVDRVRIACVQVDRTLASPRAIVRAAGSRAGVVAALDRPFTDLALGPTLADVIALPANIAVWSLALPEARVGFTWEGDAGVVLGLEPAMGRPAASFSAWVFETGSGPAARFALLAQPGEAVQELGRAWRALAAERGIPDALVFGLTNGALAYVTPSADFGRDGYEYDSTLFGPSTGDDVTAALALALDTAVEALEK